MRGVDVIVGRLDGTTTLVITEDDEHEQPQSLFHGERVIGTPLSEQEQLIAEQATVTLAPVALAPDAS